MTLSISYYEFILDFIAWSFKIGGDMLFLKLIFQIYEKSRFQNLLF